uniref:Uncharacterized protein n=1 Tax=Anguilla anguilla TaxID=7936 RepID=A0A0E9XML8_ANGAN
MYCTNNKMSWGFSGSGTFSFILHVILNT